MRASEARIPDRDLLCILLPSFLSDCLGDDLGDVDGADIFTAFAVRALLLGEPGIVVEEIGKVSNFGLGDDDV